MIVALVLKPKASCQEPVPSKREVAKLGCRASLRTPISPSFPFRFQADGSAMENVKALLCKDTQDA
jgi:hypothetical protein